MGSNSKFYMLMQSLYKMSNSAYISFVDSVLQTPWYIEQKSKGNIKEHFLHRFLSIDDDTSLIKFIKEDEYFYSHKYNTIQFEINKDIEQNDTIQPKLVNIELKNRFVNNLIKSIVSLQKDYLISNKQIDLKYLSYDEIIEYYQKNFDDYIDKTMISKMVLNTYFVNKSGLQKLKYLLPKKSYIHSCYIMNILSKQKLKDKDIQSELLKVYGVKLSLRSISHIKNNYNITSIYNDNFISQEYMINNANISKIKDIIKATLIVKLHKDIMIYKNSNSDILLIHSSNDIKKDLSMILKDKSIQELLDNSKLSYCYSIYENDENPTEKLINDFYLNFGDFPYLNKFFEQKKIY